MNRRNQPLTRGFAMLTSLLLLIGTAFAVVGFAAPASADPYPAQVRTTCSIDAPSTVRVGNGFKATVEVTSDGTFPVTGTVKLVVRTLNNNRQAAGSSARVLAEKEVDYNGRPVSISVDNLSNVGSYQTKLTFTPDGTALRGCSSTANFRVLTALAPSGLPNNGNGNGNGGVNQNGILPDTGGPALLWLLLGLALLGAGGGVIAYSRRDDGSAYRT